MERTWTTVGADVVERVGGREKVESAVAGFDWQEIPEGGKLTVGFMPGAAIKATIRQLELPKVSAIAIDSFECPAANPDEDGFYPGFYGIECHYKNGRARVYVVDTGTAILPVASDFWAEDEQFVNTENLRALSDAELERVIEDGGPAAVDVAARQILAKRMEEAAAP